MITFGLCVRGPNVLSLGITSLAQIILSSVTVAEFGHSCSHFK